ncbi:MAG: glycoside hydrolase family 2 [Eggerthellaceae bacterium]|nr:glycoside hydrolase family 2 [Eggerthellaceae bacterium]
MLNLKRVWKARPKSHTPEPFKELMSQWGKNLDPDRVLPQHPCPRFMRNSFINLNGLWSCLIRKTSPDEQSYLPHPSEYDKEILVPFSPECKLSGVEHILQPDEELWYYREVEISEEELGINNFGVATKRLLLHFGAVDYACRIYINDTEVGGHVGGYTPFDVDITDYVKPGYNSFAVYVVDPSDTGVQLRGKQKLKAGNIWYTAQSGIWQSVWMESVPAAHMVSAVLTPDIDNGLLLINATVNVAGYPLSVYVYTGDGSLVESVTIPAQDAQYKTVKLQTQDGYAIEQAFFTAAMQIPAPHLWSPEDPFLYDVIFYYGEDEVSSYTAFRKVEIGCEGTSRKARRSRPRFLLNGKAYFVKGVLDQGYWPESLMTAPDYEAFDFDILSMKQAGFNTLRMHLKIEAERFYYACDKLGMLVWQDMPCGGGAYDFKLVSKKPTLHRSAWDSKDDTALKFKRKSGADSVEYQEEWLQTLGEMIELLGSHPCVATWTLFNEGWGQFDAVRAVLYASRFDRTRPIDATSGWFDRGVGDYVSIHNYFRKLRVYRRKRHDRRAFILSEIGGYTHHIAEHSSLDRSYGYASFEDADKWEKAYKALIDKASSLEKRGCSGFIFTQLCDIEEETNGILTYDREVNKLESKLSMRLKEWRESEEHKAQEEEWAKEATIAEQEAEEFFEKMREAEAQRIAEEEEQIKQAQETAKMEALKLEEEEVAAEEIDDVPDFEEVAQEIEDPTDFIEPIEIDDVIDFTDEIDFEVDEFEPEEEIEPIGEEFEEAFDDEEDMFNDEFEYAWTDEDDEEDASFDEEQRGDSL